MEHQLNNSNDGSVWATRVHPLQEATANTNNTNKDYRDNHDNKERKANFKMEFKEFSGNTTLHGLRYVGDPDIHILRRLIWLVMLLGLAVWLCFGLSDSLSKYFSRPISTVITMNYVSNITFPAITICNYNLFKSSLVTPTQAILVSSAFNIDPNERVYVNWTAYEIQTGRPIDLQAFINATTHQIEDMLLGCRWRSIDTCSAANFTRIITDWGICYTFNNDPENALQVKQPGSNNGLSLKLNVEQYEYTYGENTGAGFKVLLHPQGQHPLVKELGFSVAPGFETSVSVRYNSIKNLKHPYRSNCTERQLRYSEQYTVPLCRYECKIAFVTKMCGCRDIRYRGDERVCSPLEQIDCIYPAEANFTASDIDCDCQVPCSSTVYEGRISMAHWPSLHIAPQITSSLNRSAGYARENLLDLKIYLEELSYQEIEQVPSYDVGSFQGDVGGYMGLLCGMSIITIGEFVDFIAILMFNKCKKRCKR